MMRSILALSGLALTMAMAAPATAAPKGCPPGLAKKAVPCVPPGQAKKLYGVGRPLPADTRYERIRDYDRYGVRRPAPGEIYIRLDDDLLRVAEDTRTVLEIINLTGKLLR
ncbi:RcnB family protein [Oceanomicrobium pacificus]|uniref:Excinuclease ABC subunit A n=1 Tax=Oceanomicrobium pacificus TaxID=2692916 RepID=A0A6B0TY00_9RHOB|nr:RcnB family protein [Oceanomicrobium pacificus]MXU65883.1 excinuclease ABC subunit A [Oceanomicrobium pacificus]